MPMFNHWHKYKWDRIYYFFCPCLMAVASCSLIRDRTQALGSESAQSSPLDRQAIPQLNFNREVKNWAFQMCIVII